VQRALLDELLAARHAARPAVLVTELGSGAQQLLFPLEPAPPSVDPALWAAAGQALTADRSTTLATTIEPGGTRFLHVFNPPLRLYVVGAVHIAQGLAPMAALAGFEVVVIDPRRAFATTERFPQVELVPEWPEPALAARPIGRRTAVVTLTHDPKLDDPALAAALRSPAFYIGALGSKKTHAARLERLRAAGFSDGELARIQGPAGLDIGARSTGEIAVSILAGVIAALRGE
jgi:xanthine dehydrogenase accessory factor